MSATLPGSTSFDPAFLTTREFHLDPYPTYRYLRDNHPLYYNPLTDTWLITRYDDVVAGFRDHERLSSRIMETSHSVVFGPSLTAMDGEEHTQKRNIIAPEFVGKKLEAFVPVVEENARQLIARFTEKAAKDLIEGFADAGEVDLVDQFSTRLPVNVILDMLGLPKADHDFFHDCYTKFMAGLGPDPVRRKIAVDANAAFHRYIDPYVKERMVNPGNDLISKLCTAEVDGQRLSELDIKAFTSLLLTAGGETTDKAIANLWYLLLNDPEQFAEVQRDPSLFDQAFTETMRHSGPVAGEPRLCTEPIEMYGQVIPEGAAVTLSMHSANHDDRVFKDPETFNIFRDDLYFGRESRIGHKEGGRTSHLGFGLGKHFCVGYQLARTEAVLGSKLLLEAMKSPRIKEGQNPVMGEGMAMRSVKRLPIVFDVV
jgi:pulcherriminic acid synthase